MQNVLIETIISKENNIRDRSIRILLKNKTANEIMKIADELEIFRKNSNNLYHKVRASLFLFEIYRFHLQDNPDFARKGDIPLDGIKAAFNRDFEQSIQLFSHIQKKSGCNGSLFSALAQSYYNLAFSFLLKQVKISISQCKENHHLFNLSSLGEYPFQTPKNLTIPDSHGNYAVGMDASPIRLDPSHSGWSDIFFLGMDFPEGAKVVNISVDLKVRGNNEKIKPPCECYCRYIREPIIKLASCDLSETKNISSVEEIFNFGNDHLSLLKAGVIASGIIPPCFEHKKIKLADILKKLLSREGGIEIVTKVNGIPKGSRLAVSTTLLATIITQLMRFSGQIKNQEGCLNENEKRIVASRAILGEWLGGSGGGWQDSGSLWPGIKVITGTLAKQGCPEFGVSRGCLLPKHELLSLPEIIEKRIVNSMVIVHGGISQDVGPILEMVTEKYLLRYGEELAARKKGIILFDKIVLALKKGNMKELGKLTTQDWEDSIQKIIPGVNNSFTMSLINKVKEEFKEDYWGFLMLGGMSGGGMAFIVNPDIHEKFKERISIIMKELKQIYKFSYPFIIEPLVYDFAFNHEGIKGRLLKGKTAKIPKLPLEQQPAIQENEITEEGIKKKYGFDSESHEFIKSMLKSGKISLKKNRLPQDVKVCNISDNEIFHYEKENSNKKLSDIGSKALKQNEVAVVTFAGGMGTRWTQGAAAVKAINPFIKIGGDYRTFIEVHLAKSRKTSLSYNCSIQHVFTTSYMTHDAISNFLKKFKNFGYNGTIYLSAGKTIGHRVYPMERDLTFLWHQLEQKLDVQGQKVQHSVRNAMLEWVKTKGEGEDYNENLPLLRFNPPGHWYEIPNMIKNGTLFKMLKENPKLKYLFCHNIDTIGAGLDPSLLGLHIVNNSCMTFEVIPRRIEDRGGGLAKVNGRLQIVEGLALPREEDEFRLHYYNTLTNWIRIDSLLEAFGLNRDMLAEEDNIKILDKIHAVERKMPAYITIKNVKQLWGKGQQDTFPVAQYEKLWGDMTSINDLDVCFISVPRFRGVQLKEPQQFNQWLIDGSYSNLKKITSFNNYGAK